MITTADAIELRDLRKEFEAASLMANAFPNKEEFRKRADSLEIRIISIESDNRYV